MTLRWPFYGSPSSTWMPLASVALLAIALGAPPPASAATFNVTKTADTADGLCDADCSLREAVIAANALAGADTIILPAGTYALTLVGAGEDISATGDLDITGDLTITGASAGTTIVDGNATDRVFHIHPTAAAVTIGSLTIRNGNVNGFGGGVNKQGSGTVQIQNSVVTNNTVAFFGGGINNNDNLGSITVDFTTVSNNVAVGGFGGGINNNFGGSFTLRDSTVSGNSAGGFGGGGLNNNSGGMMLVVRSTVSNNTAQNGGGLNNNSNGSLSVTDTLISGNSATGSIGGGGILNNSTGTLSVFASTISANSSAGFGGGGIDSNSIGPVSIQISTISGNSTTGSNGGGGIYQNSSAVITITSATITANSSVNGGRNIHRNSGGSLSVLNTIIANPPSGANCGGNVVTSSGFNLASDASCNLIAAGDRPSVNPLLAPLANNGGPTPTHGLQAGSPAVDTGTATSVPIDQRGIVRPVGAGFDIGAFEGTVGVALPTLSINSVAAAEGNTGTSTLTFTVTLSAASAQTVTVNYATANGSATAGSDFTAASGVLTFATGVTTQPIPITLIGDTAVEGNETFVVNLSAPTNATLASAQGTGTITNDDGAAPPSPADIPTLSEWALLLLAFLVAGTAGFALRRRTLR